MEFLLECIGFDPQTDLEELYALVRAEGETVAWRGPEGEHLRLPLATDVELRLDLDEGEARPSLLPYCAERSRLRIGVDGIRLIPDSPFDALLSGWVAPPVPGVDTPWSGHGAYALAAWLTDARRLPNRLRKGHVLAISVAGFALDVRQLQPDSMDLAPAIQELPRGASIQPLGGMENPGGCSDVSARIKEVRHTINRLTGHPISMVTIDAPERPLRLFISPWQLERDNLPAPRPGYRIEGTFLFTGRIAGGLPRPGRNARRNFG
ncbi:MAG: hypothetical protein ACI9F9_001265 [Candidatus Paceibacteria bacterium]|jgi:hypothetical protein